MRVRIVHGPMVLVCVAVLAACGSPIDPAPISEGSPDVPTEQPTSEAPPRQPVQPKHVSQDGRHVIIEIEDSPCYPLTYESFSESPEEVTVQLQGLDLSHDDESGQQLFCPGAIRRTEVALNLDSPLGERTIRLEVSWS